MQWIKNSIFVKLLNKLDIQEDGAIIRAVNDSVIINKAGSLLGSVQNKLSKVASTSHLVKNIDNLILLLLAFTLFAIPVASTGIIGLLTAGAFFLLLIKYCCFKGERYRFASMDLPVFLYIAIAGLSVTFSSLFMPSLKGYIKMLIYFGGYLTFVNIFRSNPKRMIFMLGALTAAASLEAFYAIYQQVVGVESLASWQDLNEVNPEQLMNRVYGTLKPFNPNLLAGYLIATFAPALGMGFWFLNKKNVRLSLGCFIGAVAILLAIVFTGSRGAYIAIAAMASMFVLISGHIIWHDFGHIKWLKKLWIACIILGLIGVIGVILFSPAIQHRVLSIFMFRADSSNSYRFNVYAACLQIIKDNWLIGIGPGNTTFRLIYGLYMITGFDALGAYSIPLEVAVEMGLFGLAVFVWMILMAFIKGVKYIHNKRNALDDKIIISSCIIAITGLMAHGLVDTVFYRPQINIVFWMIMAIMSTMFMKSTDKD